MFSHCLLTSMVSDENQLLILLRIPYTEWVAFLLLLSKLSLYLWLSVLWLQYVSVCITLNLSHLEFVELMGCIQSCLSSNFGSIQSLFLEILFLPFLSLSFLILGFPNLYVGLMVYHRSLRLYSLFSIIFFLWFLGLGTSSCPIFRFADSDFCLLRFASEPL